MSIEELRTALRKSEKKRAELSHQRMEIELHLRRASEQAGNAGHALGSLHSLIEIGPNDRSEHVALRLELARVLAAANITAKVEALLAELQALVDAAAPALEPLDDESDMRAFEKVQKDMKYAKSVLDGTNYSVGTSGR